MTTSVKPAPLPGDLTTLDKAALITLAAGVAFKLLLHNVGATLETTAWWFDGLRWVFGLVAFVAFDLVVLAVIVDGRRNPPDVRSYLALGGATLAAALIGLDVAGVWRQPWMQAAQAVLMLLFGVHLMRPRLFASVQAECARLTAALAAAEQSAAPVGQLRSDLDQHRATVEQQRSALEQAQFALDQGRATVEQQQTEIDQLRAMLRDRPIAIERPTLTDGQDALVAINGRSYSVRRLAAAFGVAPSTAAKRLQDVDSEGGAT